MPETIPQIRPSFNRSLRLETRPELLSADTGALVQREMMDRSGLIDWLTERLHDPRHPSSIRIRCRICCGLDSCCWGRAGATSPTPTACVRIRACGWRARPDSGHGGLGGGPGAGIAADLVPTAGHAQPGGEPSGPAPGGDGAGVPSDRDDRRSAAKTGETDPTEGDGKRRCTWTWTVSRSRSMGILREANGTDTIASGCTTGWWRVVPRRGT